MALEVGKGALTSYSGGPANGQKPPSVKDSFPAFHPAPLTVAAAWQ
jgi:hypothetical protein